MGMGQNQPTEGWVNIPTKTSSIMGALQGTSEGWLVASNMFVFNHS